jgi:hypothetical protein
MLLRINDCGGILQEIDVKVVPAARFFSIEVLGYFLTVRLLGWPFAAG